MIDIENLSCSYGAQSVFENISLKTQSSLSVLGANGSGKSTFAKALCALVDYKGAARIEGEDIQKLPPKKRASLISYIPAKLEIYDEFLTLEEFVLQGRFIHKKSYFDYGKTDKKIATAMMQKLNIEHLAKHSVSSLSSGEQQLSLIAQTLAQESKIIIFDEPTANLDPHNSKTIAQTIKELQTSHQIILITHDLHLASFMQNPVIFIKERSAFFFEEEFFSDENLQKLYGVKFNSLVASYE
jgi:iron complex transport system ATP-binding protein